MFTPWRTELLVADQTFGCECYGHAKHPKVLGYIHIVKRTNRHGSREWYAAEFFNLLRGCNTILEGDTPEAALEAAVKRLGE